MSTPKVSFSDLEDAFLDSSYEHHYWLDKRTGEVLFVDGEISRYPAERERWFGFEERRQREAIEEWAREKGVEISFEARR